MGIQKLLAEVHPKLLQLPLHVLDDKIKRHCVRGMKTLSSDIACEQEIRHAICGINRALISQTLRKRSDMGISINAYPSYPLPAAEQHRRA
jgi:hypothetical protein